jgi:hypothetical protein
LNASLNLILPDIVILLASKINKQDVYKSRGTSLITAIAFVILRWSAII